MSDILICIIPTIVYKDIQTETTNKIIKGIFLGIKPLFENDTQNYIWLSSKHKLYIINQNYCTINLIQTLQYKNNKHIETTSYYPTLNFTSINKLKQLYVHFEMTKQLDKNQLIDLSIYKSLYNDNFLKEFFKKDEAALLNTPIYPNKLKVNTSTIQQKRKFDKTNTIKKMMVKIENSYDKNYVDTFLIKYLKKFKDEKNLNLEENFSFTDNGEFYMCS